MSDAEALAAQVADRRRAELRSTLLDGVGAALVVAGVALFSIPAGFIVAGIAVLLVAHPIPIRGRK